MKNFVKNIGKSVLRATNSEGNYPQAYVDILEPTTDALRKHLALAKQFHRQHPSTDPEEYLELIKHYTNDVAKEQEGYTIELYLPFHMGLFLLMLYHRPLTSIETGVERGGSTLALLKGLYENNKGVLYSFDISNSTRFIYTNEEWKKGKEAKSNHRNVKRVYVPIGTLVPEWLKSRWHLIIGDSKKNVPKILKKVGMVSFVCLGHSHTYDVQKKEVDNTWDSLIDGGIMVIDRSDWEDDKCFNEMLQTKKIAHYVTCKESNYSLKFNYVILVKGSNEKKK